MKKAKKNEQVIIYQTRSGALELRADVSRETVWANRMQMAKMFSVNPQAISKHIKNIYKEKELQKKATSSKMELVQTESRRRVRRFVDIYNLDVLIAVGYRINSVIGTRFRKWATKTLHSYISDGYAINKNRIAKNYQQFLAAVDNLKHILPSGSVIDTENVLELISMFASTWFSLEAYDKDALSTKGITKKKVYLTVGKLKESLVKLKQILIEKGEASELFGLERTKDNVSGIIGNIMQTFDGKELYPTIEEKAAHLLYFMVKDHPFSDGNKRSGAYSFIWFLNQAKILNTKNMTPSALTALTILVAESSPKDKEKIIGLILAILS
ncbi:MAG: RhuM family protein [Patescibacteria group bacterium]